MKYNEIDFEQQTLFNMKKDPFEIKNLMEEPTNFHLKLARFSNSSCSHWFQLKQWKTLYSESHKKMDAN